MAKKLELVIAGDAKGALKALRDVETGGGKLSRSLRSIGSIGAGVTQQLNRAGGKIVGAVSTLFKRVVQVGAVAIGASIAGGIGRLLNIEDAQAKLRGLGHDTRVIDQVMTDALASVKGTAYGLDAAATSAAGAIASGVKPGQDLERTLKLVADTATIAGADFSEMGDLFNKVSAQNRVTLGRVNELSSRGVPILQMLAEHYGVTAEEASKMVSRGEVDFAAFRDALEKNIGGAALESGNTTRGAFANMRAAASRFGAALAGPVFGETRGFFVAVTGWIDGLTAKVGPLAEQVGDRLSGAFSALAAGGEAFRAAFEPIVATDGWAGWVGEAATATDGWAATIERGEPTFDRFVDLMGRLGRTTRDALDTLDTAMTRGGEVVQRVSGWIDDNHAAFERWRGALGPVLPILAAFAVAVTAVFKAIALVKLGAPIAIITALATAISYAWQNSERFRNVITGAMDAVRGAVERVRALFGGGSESLDGRLEKARGVADRVFALFREGGAVFEWWQALMARLEPRFEAIKASFTEIGAVLGPVVSWIGERLPGAFSALWSVAQPILRFIVGLIGDALAGAITGIVQVFQGVVGAIANILKAFKALFTGDWAGLWEAVKGIFTNVAGAIVGIIRTWLSVTILKVIGAPIRAIIGVFRGGWQTITGFFRTHTDQAAGIVSRFGEAIRVLFTRLKDRVVGIVRDWMDTIRLRIMYGQDAIRAIITRAWNTIRTGITNTLTTIRTTISNAWNTIRERVTTAVIQVEVIVRTVMARIRDAWSTAWNAVRTTISNVWEGIRGGASTAMDGLKRIIRGGVEAIGNIWNGVRNALAAPINWVIKNVINKFLGGVRGIASALTIKLDLPDVPQVPTFHEGGVVGAGGRMTGGPLRPGERMIKALDGEEVLTARDPRHRNNRNATDEGNPEIGGPLGWVGDRIKDAAGAVLAKAREVIANVARPAIEAALSLTDGMAGRFGFPGELVGGVARALGTKVLDWISGVDSEAEEHGGGSLGGRGWRALRAWLEKSGVPHVVTSTLRKGNPRSRHFTGAAADFSVAGHGNRGYRHPGLRRMFDAFLPVQHELSELILAGAPFNVRNGKRVPGYAWGVPGGPGNHWNHLHAATYDIGGMLKPGWTMAFNGTSRNERVMTGGQEDRLVRQLERIERVLDRLDRGGAGRGATEIHVHGVEDQHGAAQAVALKLRGTG